MPTNQGSITPNSAATYKSLGAAIRSQSPPTLPYAADIDCDPADVVAITLTPVNAQITTARGHAATSASDKHI